MASADAIRLCRGTAAQRAAATSSSVNTPPAGVPGIESDTGLVYVGDGAKTWAAMGVADTIALDPSRIRPPSGLATLNGGTIATNDIVLVWDTSASTWKAIAKSDLVGSGGGSSGILYEAYPNTVTVNTASTATLIDYTIPAGTLTVDGQSIEVLSEGSILNNSGSTRYLNLTLRLATAASLQDGLPGWVSSANPRAWAARARIIRSSATTGYCQLSFSMSSPGTAAAVAAGDLTSNLNTYVLAVGIDVSAVWADTVQFQQQAQFTDALATLSLNHKSTRISR